MASIPTATRPSSDRNGASGAQGTTILTALGDPDCRELLARLAEEPQTASELAEACDIPSTTLYRKLETVVESGLVSEGLQISTDGRNATEYELALADVQVRITDTDGVDIEIDGEQQT